MKRLCAIVQPVVDMLLKCEHSFLEECGLVPGSYATHSKEDQEELIRRCGDAGVFLSVGGTATNSVACAQRLGVACSLVGLAGDDTYGGIFKEQATFLGIETPLPLVPNSRTGTCVSLVTPDGERTMRTALGVASSFSSQHVPESIIAAHDWVLLEGYFLTGSDENFAAILKTIEVARRSNVKIAFAASADFVIEKKREVIVRDILPSVDMVFTNEGEAMKLSDTSSAEEARSRLSRLCPGTVVTRGNRGAIGSWNSELWESPAFEPAGRVVDTTGAGDIFAGAFLAGLLHDLPPHVAARGASRLATLAIEKRGARLPETAGDIWAKEVGAAKIDDSR